MAERELKRGVRRLYDTSDGAVMTSLFGIEKCAYHRLHMEDERNTVGGASMCARKDCIRLLYVFPFASPLQALFRAVIGAFGYYCFKEVKEHEMGALQVQKKHIVNLCKYVIHLYTRHTVLEILEATFFFNCEGKFEVSRVHHVRNTEPYYMRQDEELREWEQSKHLNMTLALRRRYNEGKWPYAMLFYVRCTRLNSTQLLFRAGMRLGIVRLQGRSRVALTRQDQRRVQDDRLW